MPCYQINIGGAEGDDFGVSVLKTPFPYDFATQDNLFYEGDFPSIHYYPGISLEAYDLLKESS